MKILYHHRTLADGAEGIHIQEMVDAFRGLGHDVVIHALVKPKMRKGRQGRSWGLVKVILPGWVFELCTVGYNFVDYWRFRRLLRRNPPDLVYKRHALNDVGLLDAASSLGIKTVVEVNAAYSSVQHRQFEPVRFARLARFCERRAFSAATMIVAVSSPLKELVQSLGIDQRRVIVVPNGANPDRFNCRLSQDNLVRARYGLHSSVVVGWVGILREWHRVDLLIQAVSQTPNAVLLVVGDGPDRPRLERLTAELGMRGRVVFSGRIPHSEMPDYISAFDIAVASDDRTGYASPMKLLEYMAMERAVVAPRLPNIEDFILDGVDGMLFAPGSARDLAAVLKRLMDDVDLRTGIGKKARAKIERKRNWRWNAAAVLSAIAERHESGSVAGSVSTKVGVTSYKAR